MPLLGSSIQKCSLFFLSTIRTQFEIGMNHLSNLNLIRNSINSAQMAFLPWEVSTATDTPKIIYLCCAGNEGKLAFSCSRLKLEATVCTHCTVVLMSYSNYLCMD
jgi:hypothetical protein